MRRIWFALIALFVGGGAIVNLFELYVDPMPFEVGDGAFYDGRTLWALGFTVALTFVSYQIGKGMDERGLAQIPPEGLMAREEPSPDLTPVTRLPGGTRVRVHAQKGDWAHVSVITTKNRYWVDGRRLVRA